VTELALWLDGNGIAGLLAETFGADMTTMPRRCQSCGSRHVVGEHRAYRGAGTVLRCPTCGDVAAVIVVLPDRHAVKLAGTWMIE
jgi:DNA-directed RNA polymerase subunit RPC12/RpoP